MRKNLVYAIINEDFVALRLNHCIICEEEVKKGTEAVKITTAKNTYCVCKKCWEKTHAMRKSGNTAKNTVGEVTVYNEETMPDYMIAIESRDEKQRTRGYVMTQRGFAFNDMGNVFYAEYIENKNFQSISPMLDSMFFHDSTLIAYVNGTKCHNTEEVRDAIGMKVRNAVVNKSVK